MLHVVVNGLWGVREEGARRVAERWVAFLTALEALDGAAFPGWQESGTGETPPDAEGAGPAVPLTVTDVLAYLSRANPDFEARSLGYDGCLRAQAPGMPHVAVRVHAGGSSEYVHGVCAVLLHSAELDESVTLVRRSADILRALADAWEVDHGEVHNTAQHEAVKTAFGLSESDPRCGRAVYLSANRAALAPRGLPGLQTPTTHGGLLVDLAKGADDAPDMETLIEVNGALRAAGALRPLPVPLDRATW